jgi:DNA-binding response OmpR family regulator
MPEAQSRLLLVEDDEAFADMLQTALINAGYVVVLARNGKDALRLYDARPPTVVLTDLIMPGIEGIELITTLRRRYPGVKIIAMSGGGRNSPEAYLPIAQALGAAHTLPKPFSIPELIAAIEAIRAPEED